MANPGDEIFFGITLKEILLVAVPFFLALLFRRMRSAWQSFFKRPLFFSSVMISIGGAMMAIGSAKQSAATGVDVLFIVMGLMLVQHGIKDAAAAPDRPGGPDDQLRSKDKSPPSN